jgi:hypothetical protein
MYINGVFLVCHACGKINIVFGCPRCSMRAELWKGVQLTKTCVRLELFLNAKPYTIFIEYPNRNLHNL